MWKNLRRNSPSVIAFRTEAFLPTGKLGDGGILDRAQPGRVHGAGGEAVTRFDHLARTEEGADVVGT